jgi:hypothetical protein
MEQDKKDTFWDISRLVPGKSKRNVPSQAKKPSFAEVNVGGETRRENGEALSLVSKATQEAKILSYDGLSPLICHVEIHPWKNSYQYYEFFCKNAQKYHKICGKPCERVPFFSYVAQYSQLSQRQLEWYFWWRQNVRNRVFLDTDLSYIYLYIYEIINLGDMIDTGRACASLIDIWVHYREEYPQLRSALGEWICDYSLLNGIPIRYSDSMITADMIKGCSLPEVFFGFEEDKPETIASFLLSFCNGYQYRKSKFYAENAALYDQMIPGCLLRVVPFLRFWEGENAARKKHVSRSAFVGALCSYRVRKHIEVDYIPLCSAELKSLVTGIIKYAENILRACIGIRSRLGVAELPQAMRSAIDGYFEEHFPRHAGKFEITPAYEKLYDGTSEAFNLEKALEIEKNSWEVTEQLVDAFEENDQNDELSDGFVLQDKKGSDENECITEEKAETESMGVVSEFLAQIDAYRPFFDAAVSRDTRLEKEFCKQKGMFPEHIADIINEKAADILGDIVLLETDDGYVLIEDYREMFETEENI